MTTLNMKKVNQQHDPYSEFVYEEEAEPQVAQQVQAQEQLKPQQELMDNIDKVFDGADFVFNIANHIIRRFGGR